MNIERNEVVWIESRADYSSHEVVALSGLPATLFDALVDTGALPTSSARTASSFEAEAVVLACAAQRLREHFELDDQGLAVAVSLLRRVRVLEAQLTGLQARSPGFD